jgi:hypothetical protein
LERGIGKGFSLAVVKKSERKMLFQPAVAESVFVFFIALIITFAYTTSREYYQRISASELRVLDPLTGFAAILYALLATFTISNLSVRYQQIREQLVLQLNQLRTIYQTIRLLPQTEELQCLIARYAYALSTSQPEALSRGRSSRKTQRLEKKLTEELLQYVQDTNPVNGRIIQDNIYVGESGRQILTQDIDRALYYVLLLTAFLTLVAFWFLNIDNYTVQFFTDLVVITIICLSLYLVRELSDPFSSDLLRVSFTVIYVDFLAELEEDGWAKCW